MLPRGACSSGGDGHALPEGGLFHDFGDFLSVATSRTLFEGRNPQRQTCRKGPFFEKDGFKAIRDPSPVEHRDQEGFCTKSDTEITPAASDGTPVAVALG
mmetsp:Transcript_11909/g.39734  ORF Transcript_11909/g.39734 Transcript_11909/m.39734 type:complete len:100 (+) Transcript_11909:1524-1823(+)